MGSCCLKPVTKIIDVEGIETGIMGLETALLNACLMNFRNEEELKEQMLSWIREFGNYVTKSREEAYKEALLREYKVYKEHYFKKEMPEGKTEAPKAKKRRWFRNIFK